jgi:TolA-binding protein
MPGDRRGLPMVTAHEVAGDLWLQVHRYDDARQAYERAARRVGPTPRVTLGLARVAVRLDATSTACSQYRRLLASWKFQGTDPPEIAEARAFLRGPACGGASNAR